MASEHPPLLELTDWFRRSGISDRPWLVLGKGPTFERRDEFDLGAYNLFALNHVVSELHVDVAHAIDIDVVEDCAATLVQNCEWLVVPRYPHVRSTPGQRAIEDYFDEIPALRELAERERLVWYNLSYSPRVGDGPVVGATRFSSEAALNILGLMGVTTIRSLGIDGGRTYATTFSDLEDTTLLANGALDFHLQFELLDVIAAERGIDYRPLVEPLRVFVGADETQLVAYRVLEYSIQRAASIPVEVVPMFDALRTSDLEGLDRSRWLDAVPELCGFHGRALYVDASVLVLGDVAEIDRLSFADAPFLRGVDGAVTSADHGRPGTSAPVVALLDCEALEGELGAVSASLRQGGDGAGRVAALTGGALPAAWARSADDSQEPRLVLVGTTTAPPWQGDGDPYAAGWMDLYREAVRAGAVPPEEVENLIATGEVKPALSGALRLAPSRRAAFTSATRDLHAALRRIEALEAELHAVKASSSWRIGRRVTRMLHTPAAWWAAGRRRVRRLSSRGK